jgi:hypothetical protein
MTLDKQFTKTEHRQLKMEQRELQTKTGAKSGNSHLFCDTTLCDKACQ